ncbi:MAG TPA: MFS transporter [Gemmataceae bacterium]|jgi:OPA family sugar phosphate sensor protein UhpC-like MFS transporter
MGREPNTPADPRYEHWRWRVFAITWLAYAGFYLTRKSFAVAKIGIAADPAVRIDIEGMSWVDGAYGTAYAVGQFVWGVAGDRAGPRRVVLAGMVGSVLAAVFMGASSLTVVLGVFFCLQGLFQATGWAPLTKNVGNFFSRRERGSVFGLWSTNYAAGGLIASAYAGYWGDRLGWRYAFFIPAATLLGIAVLFWLFQRDRPEDVGLPPIEAYHREPVDVPEEGAGCPAEAGRPAEDPEGSWAATWAVVTNPNVLVLGLVYFLLKPTRYLILFWGPKYVAEKLGSGMFASATLSGLFEAAGVLSTLAAGFVSDKVFGSRRMPVCVICLLTLGGFLLVFDRLKPDPWVLGAGFFLIGLLLYGPDSIAAGAAAADFGTKRGTSTAAGWINGWGSVGAVFGMMLPGFSSRLGWGWGQEFLLLAGMVLLAGLILLPRWNALPVQFAPRDSRGAK